MAKIKHTKNELKAQREALARFQRFLPMLLLKKQQLQAEIHAIDARVAEQNARWDAIQASMRPWIRLLSDSPESAGEWASALTIEDLKLLEGNIAGVPIPVLDTLVVRRAIPDLQATASWVDDALTLLEELLRVHAARVVFAKQRELIARELRITSQRVNLFEKVKIPEAKEHIRVIKIFLGDEQTASVVRGKISKGRTSAAEEAQMEGDAA